MSHEGKHFNISLFSLLKHDATALTVTDHYHSPTRVLCETVKDFVARVGVCAATEDPIAHKCCVLNEKLDALLKTLENECDDSTVCAGFIHILENLENTGI